MALNVKAAVLICMGFVGSMSWLLQGLAPRERPLRSPLAVRSEADVAGAYGDRPAWMNRLARSNAVDTARAVAPFSGPDARLVRADHDEQEFPGSLPPLVRTLADPLETVLAAIREEYAPEPVPAVAALSSPAESEVLSPAASEVPAVAAVPSSADIPATYRVAKGDSLARIARRELNSTDPRVVQLLLDLNPQVRSRRGQQVAVGETLTLPDADAVRRVQSGAALARARQTDAWEWYTIQPKDSLASIARQQLKDGRRWREILELNGRLDPRKIVPGTRIKLPSAVRVVSR